MKFVFPSKKNLGGWGGVLNSMGFCTINRKLFDFLHLHHLISGESCLIVRHDICPYFFFSEVKIPIYTMKANFKRTQNDTN